MTKKLLLGVALVMVLAGSAVVGAFLARASRPLPVVPSTSALSDSLSEADSLAGSDSLSTPADSAKLAMADSLAADSVSPDSTARTALQDSINADSASLAAAGTSDSTANAGVGIMPSARMAKLFGSMEPAQAAQVLQQMDDSDVKIVLASLRDRQAAAILSNLPPERVAQITQAVLHHNEDQQK